MRQKILGNIGSASDLRQDARRHRVENFLRRMRRQSGENPVGRGVTHCADFAIERIGKENDEADAIVLQRGRRNERGIRQHCLHVLGQIEVRTDHDTIAIAVERRVKSRVAIVRRVADKIEHHCARPRAKNSIEQKRPDFP